MVIGTASYMPPEQARGKHDNIDARTDIWALGSTMFKALTGRYVHVGETVNERLIKAMSEHAAPIRTVIPDLPEPMGALIDRSLMFQKAERWPDARAMQTALRKAFEDVEHHPIPSIERMSQVAGWTRSTRGRDLPRVDVLEDTEIHVSVVVDSGPPDGDSIIVEIEDDLGRTERAELRRRKTERPGGAIDDDEISEVSIVEYGEHDGKKRG
jgi:serine/threonine protein kinase